MPVSTFIQPDPSTQAVNQYLGNIGGDIAVMARVAAAFAPHESAPAAMTVTVDAGSVFNGTTLIEVAVQTTGTITAPATNPRIDRVVVNRLSGAVSVVTGTESATPTPPAVPAGAAPIARVLLTPATTAIVNASISDERAFLPIGTLGGGALLNVRQFTASGTYTPTPGTNSVIVEAIGGGASGGGCVAAGSGQAAAGGGGGGGSYGRARFTSGFAGVMVTVAAAMPAGAAGAAGTNGNQSSFGSLLTVPGGFGGTLGQAVTAPGITWGSNGSVAPTGANLIGGAGQSGTTGLVLGPNVVFGGRGGASVFSGPASGSLGGSGSGSSAFSGGGGGGGGSTVANGSAQAGGPGNAGLVIVYEYA